jgi:hypothetical protein
MARHLIAVLLFVGVGAGLVRALETSRSVGGQPTAAAPAPARWEYRTDGVHSTEMQAKLNQLGFDGWELVTVVSPVLPETTKLTMVLKRPQR